MTLGNMRGQGVQHLIAYCLNDACRHTALIDVSDCPDDVEITRFQRRAKCSKCGGRRVDVRPNWKEQPGMPDNWEVRPACMTRWRACARSLPRSMPPIRTNP
jgi:hypothetical protein